MNLHTIRPSHNAMKSLRNQKQHLKVVITGGTRGLGKAMTQRFLDKGDKVLIVSRNSQNIYETMLENPNLYGHAADVGNAEEIPYLFEKILDVFDGELDMFINSAALSGGYSKMEIQTLSTLESIIRTNLIGTTMCCQEAYKIMSAQETGGAIFNLLGNGSNGFPSPNYAVYGSTKAGISQLTKSLQKEWKDGVVDLHMISPGMMITDLLMENLDKEVFQIIKSLCSPPELVAHHIVPRMRGTYFTAKENHTIKFQTMMKIAYKMISNAMEKK
jgi:chlorophyll(ide) b reductase